jgi:hypothetical protein
MRKEGIGETSFSQEKIKLEDVGAEVRVLSSVTTAIDRGSLTPEIKGKHSCSRIAVYTKFNYKVESRKAAKSVVIAVKDGGRGSTIFSEGEIIHLGIKEYDTHAEALIGHQAFCLGLLEKLPIGRIL